MNTTEEEKLRIVSLNVPFCFEERIINGEKKYTGFLSSMFSILLEKMNFRFDMELVEGAFNYGEVISPTNGTGLIGYLLRNDSDFTVWPILPTVVDFHYIQYSPVYTYAGWFFYSAQLKVVSSDYRDIIGIFSKQVWIGIIITFIIFPLTRIVGRRDKFRALSKAVFDCLKSILNQDINMSRDISSRIAWICFVWFSYIISACFTGVLLSKLTLPDSPVYIQNLEDLLHYPKMKVHVCRNTLERTYFAGSTNHVKKQIFRRILEGNGQVSLAGHTLQGELNEIMNRETCLILTKEIMQDIVFGHGCLPEHRKIFRSAEPAHVEKYYLGFRKDFKKHLLDRMNKLISYYFESYILEHLIFKATNKGSRCMGNSHTAASHEDINPLALRNVDLPFTVLFIGISMSVVCFAIEFAFRRVARRSSRNSVGTFREEWIRQI